jgi:lysophospholipase L1-like esterase
VKNGSGQGEGGLYGWGQAIGRYFDPARITIANRARGGRSSRTFHTEGLWSNVVAELRPGDFVLIQFGHNDGGPMDEGRARASIKGVGTQSLVITNKDNGRVETVYTYGHYLRQYVRDAKAKGATPIVLSLVPRNIWKEGKVVRAAGDYGGWAAEAARQTEACFIDLNDLVAQRYEAVGQDNVAAEYFTAADHTHTTRAGATVNAEAVVAGVQQLSHCPLAEYLVDLPSPARAGK